MDGCTMNELPDELLKFTNEYVDWVICEIDSEIDSEPISERPMTKLQALDKMAPKLKEWNKAGYTHAQIVEKLARRKLRTHVRAVSAAIARLGAAKPARGKRAPRTPAATSPSTSGAQA